MEHLFIPDELRAFLQQVVAILDARAQGRGNARDLDVDNAFRHESGFGGRVASGEGDDLYAFTYLTKDRKTRWEFKIHESAMREVADGLLVEVPGEPFDLERSGARKQSGQALLVWGEFEDDALRVASHEVLEQALDGLRLAADDRPWLVRLWSTTDDQVIAVLDRDECALYVVEAEEGYATSVGAGTHAPPTQVLDHDGRVLEVPGADRVPWSHARTALLLFAERGELGSSVRVDGRIPSGLMMMGDADRRAVLASRPPPPTQYEHCSLPRFVQFSQREPTVDTNRTPALVGIPALSIDELVAWANRLLVLLEERELLVFGRANRDEVAYELGNLLSVHAAEAEDVLDTADWLANEIGAIRGIVRVFASGGDLQHLLRRTRPGTE